MSPVATPSTSYRFSARASLAARGIRRQQRKLFEPVRAQVHMEHKPGKHPPIQTLDAACIAILAGAHGLVDINQRLRSDPGVQAACGRTGCAEPSVVQETLDACTAANGAQMHRAMDAISRRPRRG
jgi:bacterioferritin-associated ferredoxin